MMNMISIRRAEIQDLDRIKKIEIETGISAWSIDSYLGEIINPEAIFFIAQDDNESAIAGFLLARLIMLKKDDLNFEQLNEIEIYNIAVASSFRQRNIGSRLIFEMHRTAIYNNVKRIHLEVRESNEKAINFYSKNGFEIVGTRKNYYSNPVENALLMCRELYSQNVV